MKKLAALALFAAAFAVLGASVHRALTTPWSISGEPFMPLDAEPLLQKQPEVWNRVNVPDMTAAIAASAGPGGHIKLHLQGIKAVPNIDNVQIMLTWTVPGDNNGPAPVVMHAAEFVIANKGYTGDKVWDVSSAITPLFDMQQLSEVRVAYLVTQRNHGVKLSDESFVVDWTYFEIFDAAGNPVLQDRKPKPPNTVEPVRQSAERLPARTFST